MLITKENIRNFLKDPLFFNLKLFFRPPRDAYLRKVEMPIILDNREYLEEVATDWKKGINYCSNGTDHWAEILTVKLTELIITFNLALLAFDAVGGSLFKDTSFQVVSIFLSILSIILLTLFMLYSSRININSLSDRGHIMRKSLELLSNNPSKAITDFNEKMNLNRDGLKKFERIFMPMHSIGIYLFLGSIVTAAVGIAKFII